MYLGDLYSDLWKSDLCFKPTAFAILGAFKYLNIYQLEYITHLNLSF